MAAPEGHVVPLEVANSNKKLWLVKVPAKLGAAWKAACEQSMKCKDPESAAIGRELGRVQHVADQGGQSMQLKVAPTLEGVGARVAYRMMDTSDCAIPQYFFSAETQDSKQLLSKCEGCIDRKYDLMPMLGQRAEGPDGEVQVAEEYRALNRKRRNDAETRTRCVLMVDKKEVVRNEKLHERIFDKKKQRSDDIRGPAKGRSTTKMSRDDLQRLLMDLFDKQPHWHIIQLQKETQQPGPWLKEVLNSVAVLNKRGKYKDLYELQRSNRQGDDES